MELLKRIIGKKEKDLSTETAKQVLLTSMAENDQLIRAMRSYSQHHMAGSYSNLDQLNGIKNTVLKKSEGQLSCDWATLCSVNVASNRFLDHHDLSRFTHYDSPEDPLGGFVRGFTFLLNHPKATFEVFLLDNGISRKAFDDMSDDVKERFTKLFGERRRSSAILAQPQKAPNLYVAILTEEDLGKYRMEKMVSTKPTSPLPLWYNR